MNVGPWVGPRVGLDLVVGDLVVVLLVGVLSSAFEKSVPQSSQRSW